mgnify:CR=1 FL=1
MKSVSTPSAPTFARTTPYADWYASLAEAPAGADDPETAADAAPAHAAAPADRQAAHGGGQGRFGTSQCCLAALDQLVHGKPLAYLDNAASAQTPVQVIDAIRGFYERDRGIPRRWLEMVKHTLGRTGPSVLASRMLRDYVSSLYAPAAAAAPPTAPQLTTMAKRFEQVDMRADTSHLSAGDKAQMIALLDKMKRQPTPQQMNAYMGVTHYLKAVKAAGTDGTDAVLKKMRDTPVQDVVIPNGKIREDGRLVHDMLLLQVKKPAESKGPYDYYKLRTTIPAEQAFRPLADGNCPTAK